MFSFISFLSERLHFDVLPVALAVAPQLMDKQCPTGFFLDTLLKQCFAHEDLSHRQKPVTEAVMSTVPPVQCWNFTVWISVCVVVVLSSSVLVLFLWIFSNKRHTQGKGTRNSTCAASHQHNAHTNKEHSCPPTNIRKPELSDCEMGWGRDFCKARAEPAVPLPATELGDSALVTTKTVQLVNYTHGDTL